MLNVQLKKRWTLLQSVVFVAKQYLSICTEQSDRYGNRQVRYAASRCERT